MKKYFQELSVTSSIAKLAKEFAVSNKTWSRYYNFDAALLPIEVVVQEPLFILMSNYGLSFNVGILKMGPNTCYKWHEDTDRLVGINMLLEDTKSQCLFADSTDPVTFPFVELKYKPEKYYIFNTKIPHTVFNFQGYRYILSIQFANKNLNYEGLCKILVRGDGNV